MHENVWNRQEKVLHFLGNLAFYWQRLVRKQPAVQKEGLFSFNTFGRLHNRKVRPLCEAKLRTWIKKHQADLEEKLRTFSALFWPKAKKLEVISVCRLSYKKKRVYCYQTFLQTAVYFVSWFWPPALCVRHEHLGTATLLCANQKLYFKVYH